MSSSSNFSPNSFGLSTALCAVTVLVLGTYAISTACRWIYVYPTKVSEFYAVSEVMDLISLHAAFNQGELPESWSDLELLYQNQVPGYNLGENRLSTLKPQVFVNFRLMAEAPVEPSGSEVFICRERISKSRKLSDLLPFEEIANERIRKLLANRKKETNKKRESGAETETDVVKPKSKSPE